MVTNSSYSYGYKIWFSSKQGPMIFSVAEAAWGRLKKALQENRKGFFICATTDGRTLAFDLGSVQMVQFLQGKNEPDQPSQERHQEIIIHFLGQGLESFQVADPVDLANIFSTLKSNQTGEVLSFTNNDGELVVFSSETLLLIETSTVFVEDGYLKIFNQKKSAKQNI